MEPRALFPRYTEKICSWSFNGTLGKNLARLMDLHMWCLGCDIRREEGNLLTEFGFARYEANIATNTSSRYTRPLHGNCSLHLWGFGIVIAEESTSLYLKRFDRTPRIAIGSHDYSSVHRPHELLDFRSPRDEWETMAGLRLFKRLSHELLVYEQFISAKGLSSFRSSCVQSSRREAKLAGGVLPIDAWGFLASHTPLSLAATPFIGH